METKKEISEVTVVTQAAGLVAADLDGEKVMLNIDKGSYYGLNAIGSQIWELLAAPHTIKEIVDMLIKEYTVEETICRRDVLSFVNKLYDRGLIDID